jgi:hypothetical protein
VNFNVRLFSVTVRTTFSGAPFSIAASISRVPVHLIAELVAQGSKPAELMESYPRLTAEMIQLAPVYAAAYPLRGRPRNQPWRDQKPIRRTRRGLDTITVS